jgi:hypothetical protein
LEPPIDGFGLLIVSILSALVVPCITPPNWIAPGENVSAISVPVPLSAVLSGLFAKPLVTVRVPVRVPCAVGEKVTPAVQLEPVIPLGARINVPIGEMLQGFAPDAVTPKSPVGAEIGLITNDTALAFVTVSVPVVGLVKPTGVLGSVMLAVTDITALIPVPASDTVCGLLGALDGMVSVPRKSRVVGVALMPLAVKVTPTVHDPLGAIVMPLQVSEAIAKFGPGAAPAGCEFVATETVPIVIDDAD